MGSSAQSLKDRHPFLNLEANSLIQYDTATLSSFWKKLHDLAAFGDRQVHILHIGDSHIQADMFTGEVRKLFGEDSLFSVATRGFAFPYKLAKTNNPLDYDISFKGEWKGHRSVLPTHSSDWGLAGVSASTTEVNASFTYTPGAEQNLPISSVKIFYHVESPESFQPVLQLPPKSKNRIVSVIKKKGMAEFHLEHPVRSFTMGLEKKSETQKSFNLQGVYLGNRSPGIVYSASGANGTKVDTYFRCAFFHRDLKLLRPDLLVISLGTNDAFSRQYTTVGFAENLERMLNEIQETAPHLPVLLTTPGDSFDGRKKPNHKNEYVRKVIHQKAQQKGLAVWDFYQVMGGFQSISNWRKQQLAQPDRLHLTPNGYQLQGQLFYQSLKEAFLLFQTETE